MATTEAHQFFKLPIAIEHYREHQVQDPSISFLQFFTIHYFQGDVKDADYDRDMQLPFKEVDNCNLASITAIVPLQDIHLQLFKLNRITNYFHWNELNLTNQMLSAIWQPPRKAL